MRGSSQDFIELNKLPTGLRQPAQVWTLDALFAVCAQHGIKLTVQRRLLLRVLAEASDHPDVFALVERARRIGGHHLGTATNYRFLSALHEIGALERHAFSAGPARYEPASADPHDHIIELSTGKVVEFRSPEIVEVLNRLATQRGYRLLRYKLEVLVESIHDPPA
jgi:Fur family ferric uptake transcriptional regulator